MGATECSFICQITTVYSTDKTLASWHTPKYTLTSISVNHDKRGTCPLQPGGGLFWKTTPMDAVSRCRPATPIPYCCSPPSP